MASVYEVKILTLSRDTHIYAFLKFLLCYALIPNTKPFHFVPIMLTYYMTTCRKLALYDGQLLIFLCSGTGPLPIILFQQREPGIIF